MSSITRTCPSCQNTLPDEAQFCMHCGKATPTEPGVPPRTMHTGEIEVSNLRRALADRYRVERVIGEGGMATVYLAEDLKHRRMVALKVMRPELAATLGADRFLREVEIAAQLTHPHILPMYDSGEANGVLYYVMPFIEGESLAARLARDGELPVEEAVRLAREVAEALAYAHKRGIVHRDVKPANILLNQGHALMADFGIARAVGAGGEAMTRTGLAIGTPQYMSPEQATGDRDVDNRTDIYAVGAVLYEMLTGEPPFTGRTPQAVIARTLTERPRPLSASRDGLPKGLEAVVMQALARSAADRYPTAEVLVTSLQAIAGKATGTPDASPLAAPARATDGRRWIVLGALAMVALTAVSFSAGRAGLPQWILLLAVGLLAAGAVVLTLTGRAEKQRLAGNPPRGLAAMLSWRNAGLGGLVAVILWATTAAVVSARRPAAGVTERSISGTRVAVLPFQNQGDSTDNYVVDGITDEIRGRLSRINGLAVIASGSSNEYRGSRLAPVAIAEALGAEYLLVGRVRWAPGPGANRRVQVVSELVNRATGQTSWQQSFEASIIDVFQVQGEIASRVAAALGAQLGSSDAQELARAPTAVPAAWDAYLRGKAITASDPVSLRAAISHYEQAVALDSTLVEAWGALSRSSTTLYFNGNRDPNVGRRARVAFTRALALDSLNPTGHTAAATYYTLVEPNPGIVKASAELALRLAPRDAAVLVAAGRAKVNAGLFDEAISLYQQARELDPRSRRVLVALQGALLNSGRLPESIEAGEAAIALGETDLTLYGAMMRAQIARGDTAAASALGRSATATGASAAAIAAYFAGYNEVSWALPPDIRNIVFRLTEAAFDGDRAWWAQSLATAHWVEGRRDLARAYADSGLEPSRRQVEASPSDPSPLMLHALLLGYSGKHQEARSEAARALAMYGAQETFGASYDRLQFVRILLEANDRDAAITELETLLERGGEHTPAWLRVDPLFKSLRGNPRFEALAGKS